MFTYGPKGLILLYPDFLYNDIADKFLLPVSSFAKI